MASYLIGILIGFFIYMISTRPTHKNKKIKNGIRYNNWDIHRLDDLGKKKVIYKKNKNKSYVVD
jgi:hypothetical protein